MDSQPRHLTPAFAVSVAVHALVVLTVVLLFSLREQTPRRAAVARLTPTHIVWIPDPRPAARGGGQPAPAPPRKTPVPLVQPPPAPAPAVLEPETITAREPEPASTLAVAPSVAPSTSDTGAQPNGVGNTPGPGLGDQQGPGPGGTVYGVGNGVTAPIALRRPQPAYTSDAMRARLQGVVVLNCVVRPDGTCSDIRVTKSLDTAFGLDQQAIASAREWRFRPGTRFGEPVPVLVTLEIGFTIR